VREEHRLRLEAAAPFRGHDQGCARGDGGVGCGRQDVDRTCPSGAVRSFDEPALAALPVTLGGGEPGRGELRHRRPVHSRDRSRSGLLLPPSHAHVEAVRCGRIVPDAARVRADESAFLARSEHDEIVLQFRGEEICLLEETQYLEDAAQGPARVDQDLAELGQELLLDESEPPVPTIAWAGTEAAGRSSRMSLPGRRSKTAPQLVHSPRALNTIPMNVGVPSGFTSRSARGEPKWGIERNEFADISRMKFSARR